MKLSRLLASRSLLVRQVNLAHAALAWTTLQRLADRIASHRLEGTLHLQREAPSAEAAWPEVHSPSLRPSVLEEHFTDQDWFELAEAIAYATDQECVNVVFELSQLEELYATPLRQTLETAGVVVDVPSNSTLQ